MFKLSEEEKQFLDDELNAGTIRYEALMLLKSEYELMNVVFNILESSWIGRLLIKIVEAMNG